MSHKANDLFWRIFCLSLLTSGAFASTVKNGGSASGRSTSRLEEKREDSSAFWALMLNSGFNAPVSNLYYAEGAAAQTNRLIGFYVYGPVRLMAMTGFTGIYLLEENTADYQLGQSSLSAGTGSTFFLGELRISAKLDYSLSFGGKTKTGGAADTAALGGGDKGTLGASLSTKFHPCSECFILDGIKSKYYLQAERAYVEFDEYDRILNEPRPKPSFSISNNLLFAYRLFKGFSLSQGIGFGRDWRYSDPGLGIEETASRTPLQLNTGISFRVRSFSLKFGVRQYHDLEGETSFVPYSFNETAVSFDLGFIMGNFSQGGDFDFMALEGGFF